jgi:hypothetical protein
MNPVVYPHRIRLRGPWTAELISGGTRFRRRFGFPGRIDDYERVWLTCTGTSGPAAIWLNGTPLGRTVSGAFEDDVTALLQPRNEVAVEVEGDSCGAVALEVRRTAFLRDVRAEITGTALCITGKVVGVSEGPLELYVVCDRFSVAYATVTPTPEGTPILLRADVPPSEAPRAIKVDLVEGATVWYSWEAEILGPPGA